MYLMSLSYEYTLPIPPSADEDRESGDVLASNHKFQIRCEADGKEKIEINLGKGSVSVKFTRDRTCFLQTLWLKLSKKYHINIITSQENCLKCNVNQK